MATTVTYKGATLTTVDNQTKVLETAGTWMEDDLTLTDVSGGGTGEWTTDGIAQNLEPNGAVTLGSTVTIIAEDSLKRKPITSITGNNVTEIKPSALNACTSLTSINFPNVTKLNDNALYGLSSLTSLSMPKLVNIGGSAMRGMSSYTGSIIFPLVTSVEGSAFYGSHAKEIRTPICTSQIKGDTYRDCKQVEVIDIGTASSIAYESAFINTTVLKALIIRKTGSITTLGRGNWGTNTPTLYNGTCKIYVPNALLATYKTATNWSSLPNASTQFVALEGSPYEQPDFVYAG